MFCDKLVKQPIYEELEGDALGHITEEDEVIALADHRNVVLFDRRRCGQVSH